MKIIDFIKDNAKFHSFMTYNNSMKSFDIEPYKETHPGVYFIVIKTNSGQINKKIILLK